jgi:hypothetical protein
VRALRSFGLAVLLGVTAAVRAGAVVTFADVTGTALPGIATAPGQTFVPPEFTGGAAVGDCDGDGRPDLYFTGAAHDVLYRNRGDGTFEDVTVAANLGQATGTRGAAFADVDNDGDLDLYATAWANARHFLYVNDGQCVFTEQAVARGVAVGSGAIGRSASFGDYDRDGYLDLFVTELQSDLLNPGVTGPISHLFRNRGTAAPGFFDDATLAAGLGLDAVQGTQDGTFPFTGLFTDLDRDGWPDLPVIADFSESRLFWNDANGQFTDGTVAAGVGTDEHGMGGTSGDFDGDGRFDLFVTSIYVAGHPRGTGNRLYRNNGDRTFSDVTDLAGVRDGMWGWGTQAFDYDNDGDLDLVMTNGAGEGEDPFVASELGPIDMTQFANDPPRLWRNEGGGVFTEVSQAAGLVDQGIGFGVLTFDHDDDGDLDVLLTHNCCEPPRLYRNDGGNANHWIGLDLEGGRAPPQGVGAVVTVTPAGGGAPMVREVSASSTYLAQDGTGRVHVGLGTATAVEAVEIEWPSGTRQTVTGLAADTVHRVRETLDCRDTMPPGRIDPICVERAQRACILGLNGAGGRLAAAVGRRLITCVQGATAGTLGQTAEACVAGDPEGKIATAQARVDAIAARDCTIPPTFGPRSAADVNAAVAEVVRARDVFGPDLDAALIDAATDPAGAACQVAVAKGVARLAVAKVKAFNRCKRTGLALGTIRSAADLQACWAATEGPTIATRVARLAVQVQRKCGTTPIAAAFPGECAAAPPDGLAACVEAEASCGVCLALNAADGLAEPCHRFADGVATTYCGERPVTAQSIARQWNEELLAAIRRDTPRPTVHARNLFHLSATMWDAWRAYGGGGTAWLTDETHASGDPEGDRAIALSFAAYRLLAARFQGGPGTAVTQTALRARLYDLGFDVSYTTTAGDTPAAVGNRIAAAMLAFGLTDGSDEQGNYGDPSYVAVNAPLVVEQPGTVMADPNRWQPLALDLIITQNGIPLPGNVQTAIGLRWNQVYPFALVRDDPGALYMDPGPPPQLGGADDAGYKEGARRVVELSSWLTPDDGVLIDISPGARGNNPLGTDAGTGHAVNPVTGQPYAPNVVRRGDFARVLAEFWADGPDSETPPGHWNVIANEVSDALPALRLGGTGPVLGRLEWDVKLYLALNGAVHDAAVVAWGLKRQHDSVRPISMIRHLSGRGQSTDPLGPAYAADGIPLQPGLIEVVTAATTAPGERHAALAGHEGEIAIYAYAGPPADPADPPSGVRWIRGVEWTTYQRPTFVTPAFPGYTSGHSTFSRAAAEVMTRFTGDAFVPGGLGEFHAAADAYLSVERGPSTDVVLQWATYYDAADLAGQSRPVGGIHVQADDFHGRLTGAQVGIQAFDLALQLFGGP